MDAAIAHGGTEFGPQDRFDAPNYEVNNLDRGVNDAEAFRSTWKGKLKEFFVQLNNDSLLSFGVVDTFGAPAHAFVEGFEALGFPLYVRPVENVEDFLHDD